MAKEASESKYERFDALWVENRFKSRRKLKMGRNIDPMTGYVCPSQKSGFVPKKKTEFIKRLKICSNLTAISKSLKIDVQTFYDAVASDEAFRKDVNECCRIEGRPKNLNIALETVKTKPKSELVSLLMERMKEYD